MKVFACVCLVVLSVALVTAQNRYRSTRQRTRSNRERPVGEGRTLGLIRPLLSLGGLSGFGGGYGGLGGLGLGYDQPIAPYRPAAAVRPQSAPTQADPFYGGGGGGYGGYPPYSYNYFGYKPSYGLGGFLPSFGGYYPASPYGYRPQVHPGSYGGFGGGYPNYPRPGYASPASAPSSSGAGIPASGSSAAPPASALSGAQAAEVANLLGQLLGQQLRPIINGATASDAISVDSSTSDERSKLLRRYH